MYTDADEILQEEINQYKVKKDRFTQIRCSVVFTKQNKWIILIFDYLYTCFDTVLLLTLNCLSSG